VCGSAATAVERKQYEYPAVVVFIWYNCLPFHSAKSVNTGSPVNFSPSTLLHQEFLADVLEGLGRSDRRLSCKYFYDERGSQLFEQICELEEYYLTRTEQAIMDQYAAEMASQLGENVLLIEFGSGSSTKTRVLLENLIDPAGYLPLDISEEHLLNSAEQLRHRFPEIEILPCVADFTDPLVLPRPSRDPDHRAVYFPGSTIGNFEPAAALRLLCKIATIVGENGGLLIGIDLQKEPSLIHDAYNDASGVTARFNRNILNRINSELGADFEMDQFEHLARYNVARGRVEIFLVSQCRQTVHIGGRKFEFEPEERIFTEYSHKYRVDEFAQFAGQAGFELQKAWTDEDELFAVLHLVLGKTKRG
jgi:dimethylhistidine N-methyltransferase